MRIHVFRTVNACATPECDNIHTFGLFEQHQIPPKVSYRSVNAVTIFYVGPTRCVGSSLLQRADRNARRTQYRRNMIALLVN